MKLFRHLYDLENIVSRISAIGCFASKRKEYLIWFHGLKYKLMLGLLSFGIASKLWINTLAQVLLIVGDHKDIFN
jgi:hypothetical protein